MVNVPAGHKVHEHGLRTRSARVVHDHAILDVGVAPAKADEIHEQERVVRSYSRPKWVSPSELRSLKATHSTVSFSMVDTG